MIETRGIGSSRGSGTAGGLDKLVTGTGQESGSTIGDITIGNYADATAPLSKKLEFEKPKSTFTRDDPKAAKDTIGAMLLAQLNGLVGSLKGMGGKSPGTAQASAPNANAGTSSADAMAKAYYDGSKDKPAEVSPTLMAGGATDAATVNVTPPSPAQEILSGGAGTPAPEFVV